MDEFIRQAYADGMLNDDSHIAPDPIDYHPPAPVSSYNTNTIPSSTTITTTIRSSTATTIARSSSMTAQRNPTPMDDPDELIYLSDDDNFSSNINIPPSTSTIPYNQTSHVYSPIPPPPPPPPPPTVKPTVPRISLPYTYLSLVRHPTFPSNTTFQDFLIKGCFSSLVGNPRIIKNEYDLRGYLNDGSDCLLIRLASDLLGQRIGMTVKELNEKRAECKNDFDKQNLQTSFNERFKKFGHQMQSLHAMITLRFFSDEQVPMVINIDEI